MPPPLAFLENIHLTFGGASLLEGASLAIEPRARIALVGRNGSGKSTLMKVAAGLVEPDGGERFLAPATTCVYLEQEPDLSAFPTLADYFSMSEEGETSPKSIQYAEELGLDLSADPSSLSGGETRRAAIARLLGLAPDILLLDEPTNHLDLPAIEWLEGKLKESRSAIVSISHDRRFLEALTTRTVWIDRGKTRIFTRGFAHFEQWRDEVLEQEELDAHKLDRKIVREEHWVRYGVTARRKRNVRRLKELGELRTAQRERRKAQGSVRFSANETKQSSRLIVVADAISKSFADRKIVQNFSIKVSRGDRIGVVGPNGAGKTTLIKLLTGALRPDQGTVELGANVAMVSLDQRRDSLRPEMRVADAITDGRGDFVMLDGQKRHVATYLQDFLFSAEQWRSPVSALSGGERGRLALAAALATPSNLLVLDEPTNDLDLETLDLLEEMLASYKGTLLLVSHDRSFLDRVVTSIINTDPGEPEGTWTEFIGGYEDMLRARGAEASSPGKPTAKKPPSKKPAPAPKQQTKLSYKEKFALENLPQEIAALESEISTLKETLADPGLFERDAEKFNADAKKLEAAEARLSAAEDEWLALELKQEALNG